MRSIVVLEVRSAPPSNSRWWAWGLANEDPPGFERVWFTFPGGGMDGVPDGLQFANVNIERHLFTYTTRDSNITQAQGGAG